VSEKERSPAPSPAPAHAVTRLEVRAATPATEIFLIDHRFRRIASGIGELEHEVPPGFYKLRFRAGRSQHDRLVEVSGDRARLPIEAEPVRYESAAPVADTAGEASGHAEHSARLSRELHARPGRGSGLFVFVRDQETGAGRTPWQGVSLHALDGGRIAELGEGERDPGRGFAALALEVEPGTYRLRVETGSLGTYEMFLVTRPGWQTQAFLMVEDFVAGSEHLRRPALRSTAVLMARQGAGFDPGRDDLRLADLARIGLRSGREVLRAADLEAMVGSKFESPMLGIYGAHLLLLSSRPDHRLLDMVVANLRVLVGEHPDVLALELRPGARERAADLRFETPTMLRASWDLVVRASHRRVSLVPAGSFADRFAGNLAASVPWLLHRHVPAPARPAEEPPPFATARRLLERLTSLEPTEALLEQVQRLRRSKELSGLERTLLRATLPAFDPSATAGPGPTLGDLEARRARASDVSRVLRELSAPAVTVARSVEKLSRELGIEEA
jgi:hypothetical protein